MNTYYSDMRHNVTNILSKIRAKFVATRTRSILMLLALLCINNAAWAQDPDPKVWDGTSKTAPDMSTNKGTSEELAIQISTAAQLAWLGDQMRLGNTANGKTYGNKYWKLMSDIDLGGNSGLTGNDWASVIGHTGNAFCGYFNGNSKTVSNIQVAAVTSTKYYGLFTSIQGKSTTDLSTVRDLKISGVFIKAPVSCAANTRIGGLAGYVKQANITNVAVSNVNFTYTNTITNTNQLGGAIGCMENNTTLDNVDVTGVTASFSAATTKLYLGGVVGQSGGTANTNSITNCDVKTVQVTHSSNITGETQIGGLVGQANTSLSTIGNNTVEGVSGQNDGKGVDVSITGTTASLSVGGLLGYATGNASSTISVTGCHAYEFHISHTGAISSANIGGLVGSMSNFVTVASSNAKGVYATFGNTTTSLYLGGLIGQSSGGTANTNSVTNNTVNTVKVTHNSNITGTTYMGGLVGNAQANLSVINNNAVAGVAEKNEGKAFDVSVSGTTVNFYAGGLLGYTKGDGHEVKGNSAEKVYITNTGTINGGRLGGFIGYVESDNTTSRILVKGNTATTVNIQVDGNTVGTPYLGGFIGQTKGKASPNNRSTIEGNTVTSPTVTMNGEVGHTFYMGGFLGACDAHANLYNNKTVTPVISITNNINSATYVGGAVGYQANYTIIDGMTVTDGSINGPSAAKTVKNNTNFFVGGFIGQQNSSGTTAYQPDIFKNIAVTGININLEHYVPATTINNHKFAVGGIAGCVNAPNKDVNGFCGMPENIIFKGGKIYAPYATTSPTVSNFNNSNPSHNTMTTEVVTTIDALDKAKVKTWYYSDYELGLSPGLLQSSAIVAKGTAPDKDKYRLNCIATLNSGIVQYITVNNSTFEKSNRYQDSERDSKTVLWWTRSDSYNATTAAPMTSFTNEEQPIYPHQAGGTTVATDYPYYWYFFQGVSNASYVTSEVAANIIAGIEGNKAEAAKATPITITISNDKENERGFAERTICVKAVCNETDITGSYTYKWYVDGTEQTSTGSSINLTPHWRDSHGITVNALSGSTVVATTSYGFGPGILKTKNNDPIRSDINARGTKDNPYIIDSESALRLWSYLSTANTNTLWDGIVKPVAPFPTNQIAGHYNRAYYELGADITMGTDPFVPISHVGYGADGTWGTYHANFIFQGNFDGKGHKISGLKINWVPGQYNGNNINIYYGLFGAVGNTASTAAAVIKWGETTASNTVIKNLVIDGATLTHDFNNTTFSYRKDYTHITSDNGNNCMVGVLAGVVGGYTTIQNIEIRGSKITDETTVSDYNLAKMGLYVGGAIGSLQCAYNQTGNVPTGTVIRHIVAKVDIALAHPKFACDYSSQKTQGELGLFNVGGIIGRYIATSATVGQPDASMPKYTLYSGTINAPKAWISPVLGALRYKDQNSGSFGNYSKQWEGNNATAATQVKIDNALFYDFYIDQTKVTDTYPANTCGLGARAILLHSEGSDDATRYDPQSYQGVNYGARYIKEKGLSLELLNKERNDGYSFVWDAESGTFMHLTTDTYVEISLSRAKDTDGNYTNTFAAVMEGADPTPTTYKWEVSFNGNDWHVIDGVTSNEYTVPVSLKTKYVRASTTINERTYTSLIDIVEADKELCKPKITSVENAGKTETTFTFNLNQKVTAPVATLATTYQWYSTKSDVIEGKTAQTLTLENATLSDYNNIVWCKAIVSELGEVIETYFLISGATVIYVNGNGYTGHDAGEGDDANTGKTPQNPVKTLNHANSLLKSVDDGGTMDNNVIVIMGTLNNDADFRSTGKNPATLTGKWEETDYEGVIKIKQIDQSGGENVVNPVHQGGNKLGSNCYVLGDTKFQYLTFEGNSNTAGNNFIECHGNDVWFGKGLKMTNFRNLGNDHGNLNMLQNIPEFTIVLMATNLCEDDIKTYTNREKPQVVTIESGRYGRIMGGRYTNGFFADGENTSHTILGSAAHPVWAIVNIDIDKDNPNEGTINRHEAPTGDRTNSYTCDINCIIAGLTDGSMYGDYQINVHGGRIGYIVGGNQGNPVANGTAQFTQIGAASSGIWGQWPNATYFGRTIINVEQDNNLADVEIDNIYAGGLGRVKNGTSSSTTVVDMYLYGRTEVNMKSGKVLGNIYGGGAGGVIGLNPWDFHVPYANDVEDNVDNAIMNKVQYGRFGTALQKGDDQIAKVTLHNLNASGVYETELLDLGKSSTTLNITGGTVYGSIYGGGYGYVSNMPFEVTMQGVGSVFGTTNVNISGGLIGGSVYGGSQGHSFYYGKQNLYGQTIDHIAEMNGTVNMHIFGNPTINGDIYGAGQGIASATFKATQADVEAGQAEKVGDDIVEEYLRIATTGNTDLVGNQAAEAEKSKYKSTVNITIDLDEDKSINNVYGGGRLGAVDGSTNVVFNKGQINGNVYGGGKGEKGHLNKATVNGTTNVTIGY